MVLSDQKVSCFQETIWNHFNHHGRTMPWRENTSPYYILVSELMLQQTQVQRVTPKFILFVDRFPDIATLAAASLGDVLALWSGLGYNRRAKYLHLSALQIMKHDGVLPRSYKELLALPGIGPNTAAAIMNYAYGVPTVFIETNIRTVYFHVFFNDDEGTVDDTTLRRYVERTIDNEHPREWFWALMDYGNYLKKTAGGQLAKSRHYKKQPILKGSVREMRGRILNVLTSNSQTFENLRFLTKADNRFDSALQALLDEGLIEQYRHTWRLTGRDLSS